VNLGKKKQPDGPASVPDQLAAIAAQLKGIDAKLDRLLGADPKGAAGDPGRVDRFAALADKLSQEGNEE
jgi:hypothetical protein